MTQLQKCIHMCASIGEIPTSYLESMTYEEQLLWLCNFLENTVIPAVNENNEKALEVLNYFKNLNVQNEINEKLNEMVDDGTLERIINEEIFTELNNEIDEVNNKVNNLILDKMVTFGDSWSMENNPYVTDQNYMWHKIIANRLNLELHNYGQNGAHVYTDFTNDLSAQITNATNDNTYNHNEVKYVFCLIGTNDYNSGTNDEFNGGLSSPFITKYTQQVTRIKSLFPKAIIYLVGINTPYNLYSSTNVTLYNQLDVRDQIRYVSSVSNVNFINIVPALMGLGASSHFGYSQGHANEIIYAHPNNAGNQILASYIMDSMSGTPANVFPVYPTYNRVLQNSNDKITFTTNYIGQNKYCMEMKLELDAGSSLRTVVFNDYFVNYRPGYYALLSLVNGVYENYGIIRLEKNKITVYVKPNVGSRVTCFFYTDVDL